MAESPGTERSGSSKAIPGLLQGRRSQAPHPCRLPSPDHLRWRHFYRHESFPRQKLFSSPHNWNLAHTVLPSVIYSPYNAPLHTKQFFKPPQRPLRSRRKTSHYQRSIILFQRQRMPVHTSTDEGGSLKVWPLMKTVAGCQVTSTALLTSR